MRQIFLNKVFIIAFTAIIIAPITLTGTYVVTGKSLDLPLVGYTDPVEMPEKSLQAWMKGEFQTDFENLFENTFRPRGFLVRNYSQIQYSLFKLNATYVPDANGVVDSELFINDAMMIGTDCDYSVPAKRREMQEYVTALAEASGKLENVGKHLIMYTSPTKAMYKSEGIPYRYRVLYNKHGVRAIDCFRDLIRKTNVTYIDGAEVMNEVSYPPFYKTSFHWARPVEQKTEQMVVEKMSEVSGLNLPKIVLGKIHQSEEPFKRDADAWNGMNIFQKPAPETYYEYDYHVDYPAGYDKPRMILQGDSFTSWFWSYDYDREDMTYIFYDDYLARPDEFCQLNDNIRSFDLGKYLAQSDFVVIEANEALLYQYSSGFAGYLNDYLDDYVPSAQTGDADDSTAAGD